MADLEQSMRVVAFSLDQGWADLANGETVPITNWISDGEDTEDVDEVTAFVCGPTKDGLWVAEDMSRFEKARSS